MTEKEIQGQENFPLKIRLERTHRGFNWVITASGEGLDEVMAKLRESNQALQKEYGRVEIGVVPTT